jgi:hypothetical protein
VHPTIISDYSAGRHNEQLGQTITRLREEAAYKNLSTVLIVPALKKIETRVVAAWLNVFPPPNQKFCRLFAQGMEVGAAYSESIESILAHPDLKEFPYIITMEHDNAPPPDGIVKLLAQMEAHPEFAAIGGLYFVKGPRSPAQIWGNPNEPLNFRPQLPKEGLVECNGLGMGFTAFRLSLFKDPKLRRPWFKTVASKEEGFGTQDLYAWGDFRKHGYRCAVDCDIRVGHWDEVNEVMW